MKVTVVKAEQTDVPLTGEWVGTLDGYVNAQIQPQANGYLISQNYREGSQVEKGQVYSRSILVRLKRRSNKRRDHWDKRRRNWHLQRST
jgi:multidrug efflux pump subunit AcrA (membrane-fusion protein)